MSKHAKTGVQEELLVFPSKIRHPAEFKGFTQVIGAGEIPARKITT
jgi:hypothetical protein